MTSTTLSAPIPAPDRTARDELDRLVAASWGAQPDASRADAPAAGSWPSTARKDSLRAAVDGGAPDRGASAAGVDLVHVHPWLVKEAAEVELRAAGGTRPPQRARSWTKPASRGGVHVRMGEAAEEIVALARELGSRGIAIGSHGLTATESLFLGSVAYKVVHLGKVPVLIVR